MKYYGRRDRARQTNISTKLKDFSQKFTNITTALVLAVTGLGVGPLLFANTANAAGTIIAVNPTSFTVKAHQTHQASATANNYHDLKLSFSYNAMALESGEQLLYGWSVGGGTDNNLGVINGQSGSQPTEHGSVVGLSLPAGADVNNLKLNFFNNGDSSSDDVDISNISLSGTPAQSVTDTTTGNSYATIQAAIDACSNTCGDTIVLNSNITVPAQVSVNKKITLDGQDHTVSVSGTGYRFLVTADGTTFKNLDVTKTDKAGLQNIVGVQANDVTIDNVNFTGQFNIGDGDTSRALEVSSVSNLTVENSSFKHLRQPAYVNTATGTFSNNSTSDTKGWVVVQDSNITFTGNTWGTNVTDIAIIQQGTGANHYICSVMQQIRTDNNNATIDNQVASPCIAPPTPSTVVVKSGDSSWTTSDTRSNGHVDFVTDSKAPSGNGALSLKTDANPQIVNQQSQDKAQYYNYGYYTSPLALSNVTGALSYYTKQNSASFSAGDPSYQIPAYLQDSTGKNVFVTLTYEPYVDQGNSAVHQGDWQKWTIDRSSSKFYVSHDVTNANGSVVGSQGDHTYTLDQINAIFPDTKVLGFGANVGSNNPGYDTEVDDFTFNNTTYDFEPTTPATPAAPTNLTIKYDGSTNNLTADSNGNYVVRNVSKNISLNWTNDPSANVTGVRTHVVFPDGTSRDYYQGTPYTYTNLNPTSAGNKFAANGQGKYTYTVEVESSPGNWSTASDSLVIYYAKNIPTATFTSTPPQFVNGNFQVSIVAKDDVVLDSVNVDVRNATNPNAGSSYVSAPCTKDSVSSTLPVYSDNGSGVTVSYTCTVNTSHLVDGTTYTLRANAGFKEADGQSYGNSNSDKYAQFTFDTSKPEAPNNLTAKFQYDSQDVANGSTLNITAKPNGNNLELLWDQPANDWVTGNHIVATYPDGTTYTSDQGPNTNAWLNQNGFGQHGNGKYTYQVVAVNPNGSTTSTETYTLYYDTQSPTASFTTTPPTYANRSFHVEGVANDNVGLINAFFDVRSSNGYVAGCVPGTFVINYSSDRKSATLACDINTASLVDGVTYILRIHSSDNANYGGGQQQSLTFDTGAPTVTIQTPTDNASLNTPVYVSNKGTITISGTATDTGAGVVGQLITIGVTDYSVNPHKALFTKQTVVQADGSWSVTVPAGTLTDGHRMTISAATRDKAAPVYGNVGSDHAYFVVDSTGPTVTIAKPSDGKTVNTANGLTVSGTVDTSDVSGVNRVVVYTKDLTAGTQTSTTQATVSGNTWTANLSSSAFTDGDTVRIIAYAKDNLKNTGATKYVDVTVDNTAPAVPANLSAITANGRTLTSGDSTNVQRGTLSWQDSTTNDVDHYVYKFWTNIPGYFDGENNAWDTESTNNRNLINNSQTGGTIGINFDNEPGTYYFCVETVDAAGNTSNCSNTFSLTYDIHSPSADAGKDQTVNGETANLAGTSDDSSASYTWQQVSGPGTSSFSDAGVANPAVTVSDYGTYVFQLTTSDTAGNTSSDQVSDTFNMSSPSFVGRGGGDADADGADSTSQHKQFKKLLLTPAAAYGQVLGAITQKNQNSNDDAGKVKSDTITKLDKPASDVSHSSSFNANWLWLLLLLLIPVAWYATKKAAGGTKA